MNKSSALVCAILCCFSIAVAQAPLQVQAENNLTLGIREFEAGRYPSAAGYFEEAIRLSPQLPEAELYLARSFAQQFIAGLRTEQNRSFSDNAILSFEKILEREPNNAVAVREVARVYQRLSLGRKAREYFMRSAALEPLNPTPFYEVGAMTWAIVADMSTPLPLEEQARFIDEGFRYLDVAIAIDPDHDDAMAYKNLLFRQAAKIASDAEERNRLTTQADVWFERALDTRRRKQRTQRPGTETPRTPLPPPPPPPPARIRVGGGIQEGNVIFRPEVVYPPLALQARIQGVVVVEATINKQGTVESVRAVSGHPLLQPAALENARQWRYRPVLLNGEPTDVVTIITIHFQL